MAESRLELLEREIERLFDGLHIEDERNVGALHLSRQQRVGGGGGEVKWSAERCGFRGEGATPDDALHALVENLRAHIGRRLKETRSALERMEGVLAAPSLA